MPLVDLMGGDGRTGDLAVLYLRIGSIGLIFALIALAGQGYLRGVSDLRTPLVIVVVANAANVVLNLLFIYVFDWGLAGSAWATVVAQAGMGAAFARALLAAPADSRRPSLRAMRPLARIGSEIFVRTAALYGSFLVAGAVLARVGDDSLAAHQIAFQLFVFLALVLDAIAIAGQVIVGRSLGAGDAEGAHRAARRMIEWAVAAGALFGALMLALVEVLPHAFTGDEQVVERAQEIWLIFALMQPANGAVFALDGILIGAGDTRYLMWAMLASTLGVFVPITLASLAFDWGIVGVWFGLLGPDPRAACDARLALQRTALGQDRSAAGSRPSLAAAGVDGLAADRADEALVDLAAAAAVQDERRRPGLLGGVAVAPLHQRDQHRPQVDALLGEPVLEALGSLLVGVALEDALVDEARQPVAQHVARDPEVGSGSRRSGASRGRRCG